MAPLKVVLSLVPSEQEAFRPTTAREGRGGLPDRELHARASPLSAAALLCGRALQAVTSELQGALTRWPAGTGC